MRFIFVLFFILSASSFAQAEEPSVSISSDIPYVEGSKDPLQTLDIYVPTSPQPEAGFPVVVFIHGGGWHIGDKTIPIVKNDLYASYIKNDIILVSVNYRLSPEVKHPTHVQDVAAAVKWVNDNIGRYGGNIHNMVITGHSAGAHLISLLATDLSYLEKYGLSPSMFKAIVPVDTTGFDLTMPPMGMISDIIAEWKKTGIGEDRATLRDASPLYHILSIDGDVVVHVYANKEREETIAMSRKFSTALNNAGYTSEFHLIDRGLKHGEVGRQIFESDGQTHQDILSFLKE